MNRPSRILTWLPAALAGVGGVVLRDCVLLASAGLLGLAGFAHRMDQDRPQNPLSAALRCLRAGLGAMLASAALVFALFGAWLGWWQPANNNPAVVAVLLLALSAATRCASATAQHAPDRTKAPEPTGPLLLFGGLSTLAFEAYGIPLVCCIAAAAAAAFLAWRGLSLSRDEAYLLLWAAE